MPNLTLPGFRYLGPGNSLDSGTPTNKADSIARDHDFEYDSATSKEDIYKSDFKAIGRFATNSFTDFNPISRFGSTVGAIGLGAKTAVERIKGDVIYPSPSNLATKRGIEQSGEGSKKMATQDPEVSSSADVEMASAAAGGAGGGSVGTSNKDFFYSATPQGGQTFDLTFHKTYRWHIETTAPSYKKLAANTTEDDRSYIQFKPGSCFRLPVEYIFSYMSEGEYESLKKYTLVTCEGVEAGLYSMTPRLPFTTNESAALTANATAQIPIYKIDDTFANFNLLQYDTTELTDVRTKMVGDSPDDWPISTTYTENFPNISSRVTSRKLNLETIVRYFAPIRYGDGSSTPVRENTDMGQPSFHEFKQEVLNASSAIGPLWDYSYKPMNNVAWINNSSMGVSNFVNGANYLDDLTPTGVGKTNIMKGNASASSTVNTEQAKINELQGIVPFQTSILNWKNKIIEDSRIILHQKEFQSIAQKPFIFGMDFLRNNDGTIIKANWEIVTTFKIHLKCHIGTIAQFLKSPNQVFTMGYYPAYTIGSSGNAGLSGVSFSNNLGTRLDYAGTNGMGIETTPWWNKPSYRAVSNTSAFPKSAHTEEVKKKRVA
nr:MAG: hypothetical protein [Parvoviridae sp.]